jgi:hypothetical protein
MASQQFPHRSRRSRSPTERPGKPVVRYQFTVDAGPPGNWQRAGTPPSRDGPTRLDIHTVDRDARGNTLLPMRPI